jgi:hypothetical protein
VTPETWRPFLARVACTRDEFRAVCERPEYAVNDPRYVCFEFNPLVRYPVLDVGAGRFLAVDPRLVVARVTGGLFYDLFERDRTTFSTRFGDVFGRLAGDMLGSVCPSHTLWSGEGWERQAGPAARRQKGKRADWAYRGAARTVLFECKSLRPSLPRTQYGAVTEVQTLVEWVASALEQTMAHADAIRAGAWASAGLPPAEVVCVLLTYGRLNTANLPFFRRQVCEKLADRGVLLRPFVVLSLDEFDMAIRLADQGELVDAVMAELAAIEGSAEVMQRYSTRLADDVVSRFARTRGESFLATIAGQVPEGVEL